jgi:hypothetical protein
MSRHTLAALALASSPRAEAVRARGFGLDRMPVLSDQGLLARTAVILAAVGAVPPRAGQ